MARKAQSDNMLEKMRDQHAQDKVNDRMETGSFPTVRKKPRKDLNRGNIELFGKGYLTNFIFCVIGAIVVLWIWKKLFD